MINTAIRMGESGIGGKLLLIDIILLVVGPLPILLIRYLL